MALSKILIACLNIGHCFAAWYDGIESILVLDPQQSKSVDWNALYSSQRTSQFDDKRFAILLTAGHHEVEIGMGYYMSLYGVGRSRSDVSLKSFYAKDLYDDGSHGGATANFWRSVEGVTATNPSLTWATSQACPMRRVHVLGELRLSETGRGTHWSSGGFLGDSRVDGKLHCGTQQQFFFRNNHFASGTRCASVSNGAFVGCKGQDAARHVSDVRRTPEIAEKPYLVEESGNWFVAVPPRLSNRTGTSGDTIGDLIPFSDVYVARASDDALTINNGTAGKRALVLTPGIYSLDDSIEIVADGFVVLGLGYATLVATSSAPALRVTGRDARVSSILFEAGFTDMHAEMEALLDWEGPLGIGHDIFSRVGSFPGRGCNLTRADVHVRMAGQGTILDNTWMWHADHDWCERKSDTCVDRHGLVVDGDDVITYGLKAEHMFDDHVLWNGDGGRAFFFQCELPYHRPNFGTSGKVGYRVADHVASHYGVALGVYIIFDQLQHATAFAAPTTARFENLLAWCVTGSADQFDNLLCLNGDCQRGTCSYNKCRLYEPQYHPRLEVWLLVLCGAAVAVLLMAMLCLGWKLRARRGQLHSRGALSSSIVSLQPLGDGNPQVVRRDERLVDSG